MLLSISIMEMVDPQRNMVPVMTVQRVSIAVASKHLKSQDLRSHDNIHNITKDDVESR